MEVINRRDFLQLGLRYAALFGLGAAFGPRMAGAVEALASGQAPVIWIQAQSCSGCSVSLLNAEAPGPLEMLTRHIQLLFHPTLSAAAGDRAREMLESGMAHGRYHLVVEGSIPEGMPEACRVGGEPVADLTARAARNASTVIAVGTCAAFGGIPAAQGAPTGAVSVDSFLSHAGVSVPIIQLPGCPAHPDWIVGTLAHLLRFGPPALDDRKRPRAFFSRSIHDQCPRFSDYERQRFARNFSEEGCLFKLGCLGPITHADCTVRYWNGRTNSCIPAGGPCIGCAGENFCQSADFPFYPKGQLETRQATSKESQD